VDAQLLDSLSPTHIVTQSQCEVCAVSLKDVEAAACQLIKSQPQIVSLQPNCLADIFADILRVGDALMIAERALKLNVQLKDRLDSIASAAGTDRMKPTIVCVEWIDPLMVAGNWTSELIEIAAGDDLLGTPGNHSKAIGFSALVEADPQVIVVAPCGFDIARTLQEMPLLAKKPGFGSLQAVRNGRLYVADGNQFFNRPGPRIVETCQIIAELLHPSLNYGHQGSGWVKYEAISP
jgi:iron complex transport system substrate-binding protein